MRISYYTHESGLDTSRGYGSAGIQVVNSLQRLGHRVSFDDPAAPIQLNFAPPSAYKNRVGQYTIGYVPWESTEVPHDWVDRLNLCDEVWATSDWVKSVLRRNGIRRPLYTYHHGVDQSWQPVLRPKMDKVRFLHIGEPALRKGGQMAVDAFRAAFGDRDDVHLTVKAYYQHYIRVWQDGTIHNPDTFDNVTLITENVSAREMRDLYAEHDVLVYPSYGEGFGLIPLQALATGMPVICTESWAPYHKFLRDLGLPSTMNRSVWSLHPGDVFYPDYNSLVYLLKKVFERIDEYKSEFYAQAEDVHKTYDWDTLTARAFEHIQRSL